MKSYSVFIFCTFIASLHALPRGNFPVTECGGVIALSENEEGLIEYNYGDKVRDSEICIWTIRSPYSNTIQFTLEDANFESGYDYLQVHSYETGMFNWQTLATNKMRAPGQFLQVQGPVAFVVLTSDMDTPSDGFQLKFSGSPRNLTAKYPINCNYTDLYFSGGLEPINLPEIPGPLVVDYELSSIVITQPEPTALHNIIVEVSRFHLNEFDDVVFLYEVSRAGLTLVVELTYEEQINVRYSGRSFIVVFRTADNYHYFGYTGITISRHAPELQ